MKDKKENLARFGIFTKGFVYVMIGVLTLVEALGSSGKKTGSSGVLDTLRSQPFGQVLLGITALGLLAFIYWRCYQAFLDPQGIGKNFKGIITRIGLFASAVFYLTLCFKATTMALQITYGSGGDSTSTIVSFILRQPYGQVVVIILASIFLGKAIYEFYRSFTGKFKENIKAAELKPKTEKTVLKTGYVGHFARGIVIGVISYLMYKAALNHNSSEAGGTEDAFSFLQNEFGNSVLAVIASGLLIYGLFMLIKARYKALGI